MVTEVLLKIVSFDKMPKVEELLVVTAEEKKSILESLGVTKEEFEESLEILKKWYDKSTHLPQEKNDNKLRLCLINNKMSIEKAKISIEGYYQVRTLYAEEFFDKLVPNTEKYNKSKSFVIHASLPRLTPDLCRITVFRFNDMEGNAEDAFIYTIMVLMIAEVRATHDFFLSNIIILDMTGYTLKNMIKYTPSVSYKLVNILTSINLRIKSVHFVNISPLVDQVLKITKYFLPEKIYNRHFFHQSFEELHSIIPKHLLPSNYGGTLGKSIEDLHEDWCNLLESMEAEFRELLKVKSTKKITLDAEAKKNLGLGIDGSFKKLTID